MARGVKILVGSYTSTDQQEIEVSKISSIPLKLTYLLQDLKFFDKNGGYFSNRFRLQASKRNNQIFGWFGNPSSLDAYVNFTFAKPCRVYLDGLKVFDGIIRGQLATRQGGRPVEYSCQLVGQNLTWGQNLIDTRLKDKLSGLTIFWEKTNVQNSWGYTAANTSSHVCYPMVGYGDWGGDNEVHSYPSPINTYYWDYRPWLWARRVWDLCFSGTGYRVVSSFCTSDFFNRLIVYFNEDGSFPVDDPGTSLITINWQDSGLISEDWYAIDFIKGIQQMFNLYFFTDEGTKTIYVEPYDDFFLSNTVNWNAKQDLKKKTTLNKTLGTTRFIEFFYGMDDADLLHEKILQYAPETVVNPTYNIYAMDKFQKHFNCAYDFGSQFKEGIEERENAMFAGTIMSNEDFEGWGAGYIPNPIPCIWTEEIDGGSGKIGEYLTSLRFRPVKSGAVKPRILYYAGLKSTKQAAFTFTFNYEGTPRTTYPYAYFCDFRGKDNQQYNLNYSDQPKQDTNMVNPVPFSDGLIKRYFMNRLSTLRRGINLESFANLTKRDIANLDFRNLVIYERMAWILLEVQKYNPTSEETTKIKMIKSRVAELGDENLLTQYGTCFWGR